jgi:hypothetical protein
MPTIGWYHDKFQNPFKLFINITSIPYLDLRPTLDGSKFQIPNKLNP